MFATSNTKLSLPPQITSTLGILRTGLAGLLISGCGLKSERKETIIPQPPAVEKAATRYTIDDWKKDLLPNPEELKNHPELIQQSIEYSRRHEGQGFSKSLDLNTTPNNQVLYSMIATAAFYGKKVPALVGEISGIIASGKFAHIKEGDITSAAHLVADYIYYTPDVSKDFKNRFFDGRKIECLEMSSLYAAALIALSPYTNSREPVQVAVAIGLFAEKDIFPNGTGHAWVHYMGKYLDPALTRKGQELVIKEPPNANEYLPISGFYFIIDSQKHLILNQGIVFYWNKDTPAIPAK